MRQAKYAKETMMLNRSSRLILFLCGGLVLAVLACGCSASIVTPLPPPTILMGLTYSQEATYGIQTLQQWYSQSSGLYPAPSGWWNSANAITVLVNYSRATNSAQYVSAIANTFNNANRANGTTNSINNYDDD